MVKKMTNSEILTAVTRINAMQNREAERGEKLFGNKIKLIYAIKKNKEKLTRLLKPYEEARKELLEECNSPEAQLEDKVKIRKDCRAKWQKEINELLEIEVDVEVHTVKFEELDNLSLSVSDLEAIDFMIETPDEFKDSDADETAEKGTKK